MFESTRAKIEALRQAAPRACAVAAPRIEARLREDATTRRGNVPSFGKMGDVPIVARAVDDTVALSAPSWVHAQASKRGQTAAWAEILADAARTELARILGSA